MTKNLSADIAAMLDKRREAAGVSRAELARRLGVTRGLVTQALSGKPLTVRTIARIAAAIGCEVRIEISNPRSTP